MVLCLPFALALAFSSAFAAPFAAPKTAIFMLTVFVAGALVLPICSGWKLEREERYFWIAAAVYGLVTLVSAGISQNRELCIASVEWLVYGVLLFAVSRVVLGGEGRARYTRNLQISIAVAAVVVSLVTVAQFFRVDMKGAFGLYANSTGRMRMYGTLGNPDFVAAFLAVALPATIGLWVTARRLRAVWMAASALIGVAAVLTGSRGGVIALTSGVAVIAFSAMKGRGPGRAALLAAVVVACALAAGTQLNARTAWESLRGRVLIWQVSLGDGAGRSALGSGPGTFAYEYPARLGRYFADPGHSALLHFAGHERHAQNDFVEAWHDGGWLGFGSLVALLGAWFVVAIRRLRGMDDAARSGVAAAIASVTAFCAAALFDFPMHRAETWALLWLLMAVPLVSASPAPESHRRLNWFRSAGVVLLLVAAGNFAIAPLAASYELAKGKADEDHGAMDSALTAYRAALRWEPTSPDANFDQIRALGKAGDYGGALAQSRLAVRFVNEPELYILRSRILENAGRNDEAEREVEAAARFFPYSTELRDEIGSFSGTGAAGEEP